MSREKWESLGKDIDRKYYHIHSDRGGVAYIIFEDTYKWADSRIKELEENLELAIDERNGLIDSVMQKNNENSRLREAVEWALDAMDNYVDFCEELSRRAKLD
jgi:hypothetical protein